MIEVLHISPVFNRRSILTNGLIPTPVELPHHLESFRENRICTKDGKALYSWVSCNKNEKFIKDMIFCHIYIDPRNDLYNKPDSDYIDFRTLANTNMAPWDHMTYDIYIIETEHPHPWTPTQLHMQCTSDCLYCTTYGMPDEYSHDDKELAIFKKPQKNIRIVGSAEYYYDNGHNIRIIR